MPALSLRPILQHRLNPLHVYCRLVPLMGRSWAMGVVGKYEPIYKILLLDEASPRRKLAVCARKLGRQKA